MLISKLYIKNNVLLIIILCFILNLIINVENANSQTFYDIENIDGIGGKSNPYKLIEPIQADIYISVDTDYIPFLIGEQNQIKKGKNPDNATLLGKWDLIGDFYIKDNLLFDTMDFMSGIDIEVLAESKISTDFVNPSEMRGYNFIIVLFHHTMREFMNMESYYNIYLNGKYVGKTNRGSWVGHYKFFAYNLDIGENYKIKLEKMVALENQNDYPALNFYQPKTEDLDIICEEPDKVIFLLIVWTRDNNEYKCNIVTKDQGEKFLKRENALWRLIQERYLNQAP